jgi:hypothetical protein
VRARYVALIREAIVRVGSTVTDAQASGTARPDVDPEAAAALILAAVIGAQTLSDLEAPFDFGEAARALLQMLAS